MNHNSNDIIIQRQNNCISAATEIKFKSDDQNNAELISSFIPIDANSEVDKRPTPFTRRFTRKQLLSRPGNRKERLLYNASLATARCPLPCAEAGGEKSSCAVKQPSKDYNSEASSSSISNPSSEDEEKKIENTAPSPEPLPSPSISIEDVKISDHKLKSVHFSTDLEEDISRGIQVTPPQFRLRFVPRLQCCCSVRGLCVFVVRVFASQLGLALFLFMWTLLGAAAFQATEGAREAGLVRELRLLEGRLAMDLASELKKSQHDNVWWRILDRGIRRQEEALSESLASGYATNGGIIWNYAGSLLFAVTMLTTIGFGAPVPRTPLGRTSAVIYSAVSIPLHLLLVVNFGALVADKLEYCVRCMQRRRRLAGGVPADPYYVQTPTWLSWLPFLAVSGYYLFGVALFGGAPLFPLDFTTAGGVGQRSSTLRTVYAVYLECAVILAGICVNVWRNTASSGFITLGLRLDLLARGREYS